VGASGLLVGFNVGFFVIATTGAFVVGFIVVGAGGIILVHHFPRQPASHWSLFELHQFPP
jgi:hypothetical protein